MPHNAPEGSGSNAWLSFSKDDERRKGKAKDDLLPFVKFSKFTA